ncbi:MAG: hypothetical protein SOZ23_05915 [Methanosphaera sp.]|uniref:hypothetical protein n=1 Tax=Methanosphaera sp. TaxID=2666342 RepID=UPI0025DE9437|nr:hypothetical protein [Methanosphaera sp.]MCI5866796.1 hypothetical protein [Methanosphaera sp.]MDD6534310.1 hypothetical protein [Methanosphaera sp.]MDY3956305.1 hypothetical protein [Methanosphaera sp.]
MAISQDYLVILALAVIALIAIIAIVMAWRKNSESKNAVLLLEKQTELKKVELVERDLENKQRKENLSELSQEDQERLRQIRTNTSEIMGKISLLSSEVNEKADQLEAKSELLKLQKLSEKLDKKQAEIEKSLK